MEEDYEIDDQRPDEEIVFLCHMHPWVLAKVGVVSILLILITVAAFLIWGTSLISSIILLISLAIIIVYGSARAFLYKNAIFIITTHRVINVSQTGLFQRKVQELELENIYNLQYEIKGPIKSFLNFGDLELTTIGSPENAIHVKNIENPHFIHEKISELRKRVMNQIRRE